MVQFINSAPLLGRQVTFWWPHNPVVEVGSWTITGFHSREVVCSLAVERQQKINGEGLILIRGRLIIRVLFSLRHVLLSFTSMVKVMWHHLTDIHSAAVSSWESRKSTHTELQRTGLGGWCKSVYVCATSLVCAQLTSSQESYFCNPTVWEISKIWMLISFLGRVSCQVVTLVYVMLELYVRKVFTFLMWFMWLKQPVLKLTLRSTGGWNMYKASRKLIHDNVMVMLWMKMMLII